MVLAQSLGDYSVVAALLQGFERLYARLEYTLGDWGMRGTLALVLALLVFWRFVVRPPRK
jgi:hypothetical protein